MKVLHVVKGLGPGGAERLLVSLAAATPPELEVHVAYLLPWKDHLVPELEAAGGTAHLLGGPYGLADPRWLIRLVRLVRRERVDVVHLHSPAVASLARPLLRVLPGRPRIISTEHNLWSSFSPVTRALNALTLPLDDARVAVSEEVRASAWRPLRRGTEVVVHGAPVATLRSRRGERVASRRELGLTDDHVAVVVVASFREKKDYPTLLAAAASATAEEPRLRFLCIGHGPLEADIRALHVELGLAERFRFLGYHHDPARVLAACDIFTLTSRYEGLPISLIEALAVGLPSVVSEVGGIPEVVRDGVEGLLVPSGRPDLFSQAYVRLARDPAARAALATAAGARAEVFDIGRAAARLEVIYRSLVVRAGAAGGGLGEDI